MRNPARLAAALSGRPLLMREASVPALARMLGVEAGDTRSPISAFIGRARKAWRGESEAPRTEPLATAPRWLGEPDDVGYGWVLKDGVAVLEIDGPLMAEGFGWGDCWYHGYDTLYRAYEEMVADARVGAIWELVRSPGGVVDAGLPELAAFKRAHRAAAGGKPIHAFLRDGYSAAYWEPSAADRIVAARESGVGSIGAVVTHCDFSGMLEKDGITVTAFQFGKRKTDGSPLEPLSDTAGATLQAEIDQCGRWFVADVLAGRPNLTEEAVLATEAGCFFGDSDDPALSGLAHGLVDEIATERAAFAAIRDLAAARLSASPAASSSQIRTSRRSPAAEKDTDMNRQAVVAAAEKAGLSKDAIRKLTAELPDDAPADEAEDDQDESAEGADDQPEAAEPGDGEGADGEEGDDAEEGEPDARVAQAVLALPEAKGREDLANKLAFTPGMTVKRAAGFLAAAPKASGRGQLASTLGQTPRVGPDASTGGDKAPASASSVWARQRAAAVKK